MCGDEKSYGEAAAVAMHVVTKNILMDTREQLPKGVNLKVGIPPVTKLKKEM